MRCRIHVAGAPDTVLDQVPARATTTGGRQHGQPCVELSSDASTFLVTPTSKPVQAAGMGVALVLPREIQEGSP